MRILCLVIVYVLVAVQQISAAVDCGSLFSEKIKQLKVDGSNLGPRYKTVEPEITRLAREVADEIGKEFDSMENDKEITIAEIKGFAGANDKYSDIATGSSHFWLQFPEQVIKSLRLRYGIKAESSGNFSNIPGKKSELVLYQTAVNDNSVGLTSDGSSRQTLYRYSVRKTQQDSHISRIRMVYDKITRAVSLGLLGKPKQLQGVNIPKIFWGPHSLQNVFTHFFGLFVGGGRLVGTSVFGHPYGDVVVAAGLGDTQIDIAPIGGGKAISSEKLLRVAEISGVKVTFIQTREGRSQRFSIPDNIHERRPGDELEITIERSDSLNEHRLTAQKVIDLLFQ